MCNVCPVDCSNPECKHGIVKCDECGKWHCLTHMVHRVYYDDVLAEVILQLQSGYRRVQQDQVDQE